MYLFTYREREREMFYLTTHSTHFIYGYMASDIWLRTIVIVRKETRHHIGYSYQLTPSHRQDNTYHGLCYTSRGALAGTRNSSMVPPHEGSIWRPTAPWANALPLSYVLLLVHIQDSTLKKIIIIKIKKCMSQVKERRKTFTSVYPTLTLCMMLFSWQNATPLSSISMYVLIWASVSGLSKFRMTSERSENMNSNTSTITEPCGKTSRSFTVYKRRTETIQTQL